MKKLSILICLVTGLFINGYSQNTNDDALNALVKNTLTYQLLNEFKTEIPIFVYTPGFFMVGSMSSFNFPVFVDIDYFDDMNLLKKRNFLQKEIYDAINFPFLPDIPVDSVTLIRVLDKDRLLYTMKIEPDGEKLLFTKTTADGRQEKRIEYLNGQITKVFFVDKDGISWLSYDLSGDSLITKEEFDHGKNTFTKEIMKLKDGKILSIHHHIRKDIHPDYRLQSYDIYKYQENRLTGIEHYNRRGNLRHKSNMVYYYDDELLNFQKTNRRGNSILQVNYLKNDNGLLNKKTVESKQRNYTINYQYRESFLNKMIIDEKDRNYQKIIVFGKDVNNLLNMMSLARISKHDADRNRENKFVFSYQDNRNIESIRLFDHNGRITKEIYFEYSFFGN